METTQKRKMRRLLTKKPFYRLMPDVQDIGEVMHELRDKAVVRDNRVYVEVTQADFARELDPASHAINDRNVYINYRYNDDDGLYYEEDFPRYAFAYQQEILIDRAAKLTGNDIQFDLADDSNSKEAWETYAKFTAGWADKRMENAWSTAIMTDFSYGDVAFVGFMDNGKFGWKVLSFGDGDVLYPHYDRRTGRMNVFARKYSSEDEYGETHNYIDVWDDKYFYRLVDDQQPPTSPTEPTPPTEQQERGILHTVAGDFDVDGYTLEFYEAHGFKEIPVAYHRRKDGPVWTPSQETIEHREAAFSRLAQSNHDFGLPILGLYGNGRSIKEIATKDMSYASKIFIIPSDGKAEFLNRQDASNAYKTELDMLEDKIYSQSMVIKAPELKSGDTPAAAIELLYSDAYNMALIEAQEYDAFLRKMIDIFKWGYGIEAQCRLAFQNTRITFWIQPHLPINTQEITTNLATAVQNGFCSKQTASEKFYFSTPQEWKRIQQEKKDEQSQELLLEEQRLDIQQESTVETQEQLSEIQTEQQIEVIEAQAEVQEETGTTPKKVTTRKGRVNTGNGTRRGRPNRSGRTYDRWGNWDGRDNWGRY